MAKLTEEDENLRRLLKMKPEPFTPKAKSKKGPAEAKPLKPSSKG
jgi:hypothetical protein